MNTAPALVDFSDYGALIWLVHNSLLAGAVLGIVAGLMSVVVVRRDLPFAVHGISELSFAGAAGALLLGTNVVVGSLTGSLLAAAVIGAVGSRARGHNSVIGVLMPFGLGLGVLFLALYHGRAATKFGLLTGQIVAVDTPALGWLITVSIVVVLALALLWRPLSFASLDAEVAAAQGVRITLVSGAFMVLLGLTVAMSVQIVGALLVLSILVTPGAAAVQLTTSQPWTVVVAVSIATVSMVGGILIALGSGLPISPYVTTMSFGLYLGARGLGALRRRRRSGVRPPAPLRTSPHHA